MKNIKKLTAVLLCMLMLFSAFSITVFAECEHTYISHVVASTCADRGYTLYTCTKCGDFYYDSYTPALGHAYGEWYQIKEATCTEEGVMQRDCTRCTGSETKTIAITAHVDADKNGECDVCGAEVKIEQIFSPFEYLKALFKAIAAWFRAIFA